MTTTIHKENCKPLLLLLKGQFQIQTDNGSPTCNTNLCSNKNKQKVENIPHTVDSDPRFSMGLVWEQQKVDVTLGNPETLIVIWFHHSTNKGFIKVAGFDRFYM